MPKPYVLCYLAPDWMLCCHRAVSTVQPLRYALRKVYYKFISVISEKKSSMSHFNEVNLRSPLNSCPINSSPIPSPPLRLALDDCSGYRSRSASNPYLVLQHPEVSSISANLKSTSLLLKFMQSASYASSLSPSGRNRPSFWHTVGDNISSSRNMSLTNTQLVSLPHVWFCFR